MRKHYEDGDVIYVDYEVIGEGKHSEKLYKLEQRAKTLGYFMYGVKEGAIIALKATCSVVIATAAVSAGLVITARVVSKVLLR